VFTIGVVVPNLHMSITGINDVILTGKLGAKTPVVNTNGPGIYHSFLGSLDHCLLLIHT